MASQALNYDDYFESGSLRGLWREKHPYIFKETYDIMRRAFRYDLHYVNFGYWINGPQTVEAGREMTLFMGRALGLREGERLLEGGSGLGQAAVDLAEHFSLAEVLGMNPCGPQVRFANDLAKSRGLGDRVRHRVCNATEEVKTFPDASYDHAIAMECIGIFPDPDQYLKDLFRVLRPGGRVVFTVVTTPKPARGIQHRIGRLFFGTEARPPSWWLDSLSAAGFTGVERHDITQEVFPPMLETIRSQVRADPGLLRVAGPMVSIAMRLLIRNAEKSVAAGTMGYEMFVATRP